MQIYLSQNQLTNPAEKKMPHSVHATKGLTTTQYSKNLKQDTFTRENAIKANNVSFKGEKAAYGGLFGAAIGGILVAATVATGGAAAPVAVAYFAGVGAGGAVGALVGEALDN